MGGINAKSRRIAFERLEVRTAFAVDLNDPVAMDDNIHFKYGNRASSTADGRYVVFESSTPNLVPNDTNVARDVFLRDMTTGEIQLLSLSPDGAQGNDASYDASISSDGRYVSFVSRADNFFAGDTNRHADVFVKDLQTGSLVRLTNDDDYGDYTARMSADGSRVAFTRTWQTMLELLRIETGLFDRAPMPTFVVDVATRERITIRETGYEGYREFAISGNGRVLAYNNTFGGLHLVDLTTGEDRVVVPNGAQARLGPNALSADGRYLAFSSLAGHDFVTTLSEPFSEVYVYDALTEDFRTVTAGPDFAWNSRMPAISDDGSHVAFVTDSGEQGSFRIVVRDLITDESLPIAADASEPDFDFPAVQNFRISGNGDYVFAIAVHPELAADRVADRVVRYAVDDSGLVSLLPQRRGDIDRNRSLDAQDVAWVVWLFDRYRGPMSAAPALAAWLTPDVNGDQSFDAADVLSTALAVAESFAEGEPARTADSSALVDSALSLLAHESATNLRKKLAGTA